MDSYRQENGQDDLENAVLACNQIAPRGFEPLNENQQTTVHKTLTENQNPDLYTGLDKILQKYPELAQLVEVWPNLPEHIKAAIKAMVQAYKDSQNKGGT